MLFQHNDINMKSAQKLILLDVDGTLLDLDGHIPPSVLTACREVRRQGHLIYICTGRSVIEISKNILAVGFDGMACSGGAHIEVFEGKADSSCGKIIFDSVMPVDLVKQIAFYLDSRQCGFSLEKNHALLANSQQITYLENKIAKMNSQAGTAEIASLIKKLKENPLPKNPEDSCYEGVNKIVFADSGFISFNEIKHVFGHVCEFFRGSIDFLGKESGEISFRGIHKGFALEKIALYHGIPLEHTIAIGDSDNDLPMIEYAGVGIAMGNACDSLKEIADDITSPLECDGIYNAFKKHGLII